MEVDQPLTFSEIIVFNSGEAAVIMDSVELVDASDEIELVGARAAYVHDQRWVFHAGAPTFPPRFRFEHQELKGFVVPARSTPIGSEGVQLIIGLRTK